MAKFLIITNVAHIKTDSKYFGYAPYVSEMNNWLKYIDQLTIVAPIKKDNISPIDLPYDFDSINFKEVPDFNFTTIKNRILSIYKMPIIFLRIFLEIRKADHIHLRCPGNIGLIGCLVQIFFPRKIKTAKYAGNWDPKSKQPWTYKLQQFILSNTFLTKNMQVLVYGEWQNQSKNVKPFFTASYTETEKDNIQKKNYDFGIKFIFVGSLVSGKNPLYSIKLVQQIIKKGYDVTLDLYGEGPERELLERYIQENQLQKNIFLRGNQDKESVKEAYKESHFIILPSKSEGWPKAVAEGMFWGCVPITTKISCVPFMVDNGKRGILLDMHLDKDFQQIENLLSNKSLFDFKSEVALNWSRKYTVDIFQEEIKRLVKMNEK